MVTGVTVDIETGEIVSSIPNPSDVQSQVREWVGQQVHEQRFPAPGSDAFVDDDGDRDFIPAPELEEIVNALMYSEDRFIHLRKFGVDVHWKRAGGRKFGAVGRTSGKLTLHTDAAFQMWIAADNVRDNHLSPHQVEALVFHELLHCEINEKGKPALRQHDWEGFAEEIREYGLWWDDMERIGMAVKQLKFFEDEEDEGEL